MFITTTDPKALAKPWTTTQWELGKPPPGDNLDFNNVETFRFKKNEDSK